MLCKYGCGKKGTTQFKNGGWCCTELKEGCPAFIKKRVDSRKANGKKWTDESKKALAKKKTGVPVHTVESKELIANSSKKMWADRNYEPTEKQLEHMQNLWKLRDPEPWNKGLTAEGDKRVAQYADSQRGQKREGDYKTNDFFKTNNPWQGKSRSGELSPRYNPIAHSREMRDYRNEVLRLTEQNYKKFKHIINPTNKIRTIAGVDGGYQLDHIYPVSKGFENSIPPHLIGSVENLRMIEWKENRSKSNSILKEMIHENITKQKQGI